MVNGSAWSAPMMVHIQELPLLLKTKFVLNQSQEEEVLGHKQLLDAVASE